mgnify:CR=1 FL=1
MLNINLGERCRKTGGAKTLKCDEKLVRLEETYGDWVKQEKENCRLSSGAMTKELYPYRALFSPIQVNRTMIKNRVVMGPMGNLNMCEDQAVPMTRCFSTFCPCKGRNRASDNRADPGQPWNRPDSDRGG